MLSLLCIHVCMYASSTLTPVTIYQYDYGAHAPVARDGFSIPAPPADSIT